ncbi:hypothetical protein [Xanthobacter agilis]|uniref:hypothetical protein n=1 Tax=Xanthobacter agilis TaxID=47492 RepID=UPI0037293786
MPKTLTSELVLKLTEQVSGPAAKARAALGAIDQALAAIGRQRGAQDALAALTRSHENARQKVRELQGALLASERPTAKMKSDFKAASAEAARFAAQVEAQRRALAQGAAELAQFGIAANGLAAAEAHLKAEAAAAGAALGREAEAVARAARRRRSLSREMVKAASEEARANRAAAAAEQAAGERATGAAAEAAKRRRISLAKEMARAAGEEARANRAAAAAEQAAGETATGAAAEAAKRRRISLAKEMARAAGEEARANRAAAAAEQAAGERATGAAAEAAKRRRISLAKEMARAAGEEARANRAAAEAARRAHEETARERGQRAARAGEMAAPVVLHESAKAISGGAKLEHEVTRSRAAGLTEAEIQENAAKAAELSRKYPTISQTAGMHALRNFRSVVGSADEAAHIADPLFKMRYVVEAAHPGLNLEDDFDKLIKGLEIKGVTQDMGSFRDYIQGMTQSLNTFGDTLRASDYYEMFKYGRQSTQSLSREYMLEVAPTLAQELGGASAGNAHASFHSGFVGGRLKASAIQQLDEMGLVGDQSKIIRHPQNGRILGAKAGFLKESALAAQNPYDWVQKILLPAIKGKVGDDPEKIQETIAGLATNRVAGQFIAILATQQQRIEKDRRLVKGAPGLESYDTFKQDPLVAWNGMVTQFNNLLAVAGSPLVASASGALQSITAALSSLAEIAKDHPVLSGAGVAAAGAAGAFGTYKLADALLGGFGLKGAAGALTGAAAALTEAAAAQGARAALPGGDLPGKNGGAKPSGGGVGKVAAGVGAGVAAFAKNALVPLAGGLLVKEGLDTFDPAGNLWGATTVLDEWAKSHLGFDPSNIGGDMPRAGAAAAPVPPTPAAPAAAPPRAAAPTEAGGLTIGEVAAMAALASETFLPLGVAALLNGALGRIDPGGNLWGLTSGADEWAKKNLGFNPANLADRAATGAPATGETPPPPPPAAPGRRADGAAMGDHPPARGGADAPTPARGASAPDIRADATARSMAQDGTAIGAGLGRGIAEGLAAERGLIEEQARQISASIRGIFSEGVTVPVRIDVESARSAVEQTHAKIRERSNNEIRAMQRATYSDTEWG